MNGARDLILENAGKGGGPAVEKVVIMGASGRDFHNFNVYFRDNPRYRVVAFTAAQIPVAERRIYPPSLAGSMYPDGIPIYPEDSLGLLITEHLVDLVAFSYSDVHYSELMHKASLVTAEGADFVLLGAGYTMLRSRLPVIAVCAVRTGAGKSPTTRKVCSIVQERLGKRVVVVRHPMPYGDLAAQAVQRFASYEDLDKQHCTIEEREEYEPLVDRSLTVYAGLDYGRILERAEEEAEIVVWDGGNNDTPFYRPDVHIVLFDPHRAGHELSYYPGEVNMRMAHIAVVNKVDSAGLKNVERVKSTIGVYAPAADIVLAELEIFVSDPDSIRGKRALVVEDGPTLTHGGMAFGAGFIAAKSYGASEIVDPRPFAMGAIERAYRLYPHMGPVLPALGYSPAQIRDFEATINRSACDVVVFATPVNLTRIIAIAKPTARVSYEYKDHGAPSLEEALLRRLRSTLSARGY
jgi:predicted GTPase